MNIYPAILTGNPDILDAQLITAQSFENCELVQIDVIDGDFADNLTVTPSDLVQAPFGDLRIDLHLMTLDPEDVVHEAAEFAAQLPIRAVIGQVERMGSEASFVTAVREHNWKPGLSLDLDTDLESIDPEVWSELSVVQVMGVQAGAQGQQFAPRSVPSIKQLLELRRQQELTFEVILDGGLTAELIAELASQLPELDSVAVGSFIWQNDDPSQVWNALESLK